MRQRAKLRNQNLLSTKLNNFPQVFKLFYNIETSAPNHPQPAGASLYNIEIQVQIQWILDFKALFQFCRGVAGLTLSNNCFLCGSPSAKSFHQPKYVRFSENISKYLTGNFPGMKPKAKGRSLAIYGQITVLQVDSNRQQCLWRFGGGSKNLHPRADCTAARKK